VKLKRLGWLSVTPRKPLRLLVLQEDSGTRDRASRVGSHSGGTPTYERSSAATDEQPRSFNVRMMSLLRISIAQWTPGPPAAPSPYA